MSQKSKYITLNDLIEGLESLGGAILSAPLVRHDVVGSLRYITAHDVLTTEEYGEDELDEEGEPFKTKITSSRLVFEFGDIADV